MEILGRWRDPQFMPCADLGRQCYPKEATAKHKLTQKVSHSLCWLLTSHSDLDSLHEYSLS